MLDSLDSLIAFTLIFTVVSLLVTIVVQMISSVLNLRGHNLACALAETIETIQPDLAARAKTIANHLLEDPLISDNQIFGLRLRAHAVRPEELFDLLRRIASGKKTAPDEIKADALVLLQALGVDEKHLRDAASAAREAQGVLSTVLNSVESLADETQKNTIKTNLERVIETFTESAAGKVAAAASVAEQKIHEASRKFAGWFAVGQERAQEWFTMHARFATLVIGAVFAYGLQLDAIQIFKDVSTNRAMRDKLVAQSTVVLGQAEKTLGAPGVLEQAFALWRPKQTAPIQAAIEGAKVSVSPADTREKFRAKLQAGLASLAAKPETKPAVDIALQAFDAEVDKTASAALKEGWANYEAVKGDLKDSGFALFPVAGSNGRWNTGRWPWEVSRRHQLGIFFSVLLLSLGAPFWFNTLKSLASLRSAVAGKISDEEKAAPKKPDDKKPAAPQPAAAPAGVR